MAAFSAPQAAGLWLLVPSKPFAESKSRLAPALDVAARAALSRDLLRRVLLCARDAARFDGVIVVSRDAAAHALAQQYGAQPLAENGSDLNAALEEARTAAVAQGAAAVLVLPADLPALTADDLRALVAAAPPGPGVLLAPSSSGGTNALLLRPAQALPFAYGPDSCARHCALAAARGLAVILHRAPALAFDVDLPADLDQIAAWRPFDP